MYSPEIQNPQTIQPSFIHFRLWVGASKIERVMRKAEVLFERSELCLRRRTSEYYFWQRPTHADEFSLLRFFCSCKRNEEHSSNKQRKVIVPIPYGVY